MLASIPVARWSLSAVTLPASVLPREPSMAQAENGRQVVRLIDEHGRVLRWDPRLGSARQVNVFNREYRDLAIGDRIQWRLVSRELEIKNAERGTVKGLSGTVATVRWDRGGRVQEIDLARHKTWDHGYAETVFSSQSKTYDRAYVLAPVNSNLVNGQNYYTAITRARFGVKLWTEDDRRLAQRLSQRSGEKTSALEALGRLNRDAVRTLSDRNRDELHRQRVGQLQSRELRRVEALGRARGLAASRDPVFRISARAYDLTEVVARYLGSLLDRRSGPDRPEGADAPQRNDRDASSTPRQPSARVGPDR
jgi:hypothetical protein